MSHNMMELDTMVSGRKIPVWHQNSTGDKTRVVDGLLTATQAAEQGWRRQDGEPGFWNPIRIRTFADAGDGQYMQIPGSFAIARDDMPLNDPRRLITSGRVVSDAYELIPNSDLVDYMDALTLSGAHVDTCGSLFNGSRVYISALLAGTEQVLDDTLASFILLTTSHDGSAALEALLTTVRVVCWNTLSYARGQAKTRVKIRHTQNAANKMAEATEIIEAASKSFGEHAEIMRHLATIKLSKDAAHAFIKSFYDGKRSKTACEKVTALYDGGQIGADMDAVKDTAYGVVSAVAEYLETESTIRVHEDDHGQKWNEKDVRINNVLFGAGANRRDEVIAKALALV